MSDSRNPSPRPASPWRPSRMDAARIVVHRNVVDREDERLLDAVFVPSDRAQAPLIRAAPAVHRDLGRRLRRSGSETVGTSSSRAVTSPACVAGVGGRESTAATPSCPGDTARMSSTAAGPLLGPIDRSFLWIGRALLLATVVVLGVFTVPTVAEIRATDGYVQAPGRIVHSAIETRVVHDDGRTRSEPVARVRYLFTPETGGSARALLGDRIQVLHVRTDGSEREIVRRYREGAAVDVWHDAEEPWRAVLERGGPTWFAFFPPAVTLFLGALFAGLSSRALRRAVAQGGRPSVELDPDQRRTLGGCLWGVASLFVLLAVLMVVGIAWFGNEPVVAEFDAAGFEPCPAVIEESTFIASGDRPADVFPRVVFRYRAAGKVRTSDQLTLRPIAPAAAAQFAETVWRAEPGSTVTVYVDPEDAARAVLVPGSVGGAVGLSLLGLLVPGAVGAFALVLFAQARRLRVSD